MSWPPGPTPGTSAVIFQGLAGSTLPDELTAPIRVIISLEGLNPGQAASLYFDLLGFGALNSRVVIDNVVFLSGEMNAAPVANDDTFGVVEDTEAVLDLLANVYRAFYEVREERKKSASDHICTGCPVVGTLNLKMVLHRGNAVRQTVGSNAELLGPAVNVAHRLLKNSIEPRFDYRAYMFLSDSAAAGLGLADLGAQHTEEYADVGRVEGRVIELRASDPR